MSSQNMDQDAAATAADKGRRRFLKRTAQGAGVLTVAVAGGVVWRGMDTRAFTTASGPGFEPWTSWREDMGNGPLPMVRAAILASSPHNTQPWRFRIAPDRIDLFADIGRNLGSFDPYLREMHIGLGCAVENMMIAARPCGYTARLELFGGRLAPPPLEAKPVRVATVHLRKTRPAHDSMFKAIAERRTNRGHYDKSRGVSGPVLTQLAAIGEQFGAQIRLQLLADESRREALAALINRATLDITRDKEMSRDSEKWFRFSPELVDRHRDGVTLDSLTLPPFLRIMAKMMPAPGEAAANQYWIDNTREMHLGTAPVLAQIAVRDLYDRQQAMDAGRLWQRLHLWATGHGLAMHPVNQAVEMVDRERERRRPATYAKALAGLTGDDWQATFNFRIGYPLRPASHSPRRSVGSVLMRNGPSGSPA